MDGGSNYSLSLKLKNPLNQKEAHYRKLLLLQYYFGLRPFELTDARFDGDFLIVLNAKHKTAEGDKVYKKIPIPKQVRAYIDVNEPIECDCALDTLNRVFIKG